MVEVVSERGYPETRVVDVIEVAGVSRKTFYELFDGKEQCFLTTYDSLRRAERAARAPGGAPERGTVRDRRGAGGGSEGALAARRGAAPVHRLDRVGARRDLDRAAGRAAAERERVRLAAPRE
jgi:AcrR family transcriptional regulator